MKKNTWNVRCLVDESFVPSAQRTSVLYCRLSDFNSLHKKTDYGRHYKETDKEKKILTDFSRCCVIPQNHSLEYT